MSFINDIYEFKKFFRHSEKLTSKCVHVKNAMELNMRIVDILFFVLN